MSPTSYGKGGQRQGARAAVSVVRLHPRRCHDGLNDPRFPDANPPLWGFGNRVRIKVAVSLVALVKSMKALVTLCFMIVVLCSSQSAELKLATVDLQRVLKEYYWADAVAKQLEAKHDALFKELAELRLDGNRLLKEARNLQERSLDLALNDTAREETKGSHELRLTDLRASELSYDQTGAQREAEFQNQAVLANKRILGEMRFTTTGIDEKEAFDLVLFRSKVMGLFGSFGCSKKPDLDESVLIYLKKAGSDLSKPHKIEFFLYFPTQLVAELAALQIRAIGFDVAVKPAARGSDWLCFATKTMVPDLPTLQKIRRGFGSLTTSLKGQYDGWGTGIER